MKKIVKRKWMTVERLCNAPYVQMTRWRKQSLARLVQKQYAHFFKVNVADEIHKCFPGDIPISTPNGDVPIKNIRAGDEVLSYNDGHIVTRKVVQVFRSPSDGDLVRVTHTGGSFVCTPNHKIYVGGKYVQAGDLLPGQILTLKGDIHDQELRNVWQGLRGEDSTWRKKLNLPAPGFNPDFVNLGFNRHWVALLMAIDTPVPRSTLYEFNRTQLRDGAVGTWNPLASFPLDSIETLASSAEAPAPALSYDPSEPDLFLVRVKDRSAARVKLLRVTSPTAPISPVLLSVGEAALPQGAWSREIVNGTEEAPQIQTQTPPYRVETGDDRVQNVVVDESGPAWPVDCQATPQACRQATLYTIHGITHGIGLEVHDPMQAYTAGTFQVGDAFTIEPGIYISPMLLDMLPDTPKNRAFIAKVRPVVARYANTGVRLEDSYVLTERGLERVSLVPRDLEEVESLTRRLVP